MPPSEEAVDRAGPARRRAEPRPTAHRRRQLAEAAAAAFHRQGFHRVTVAGVAADVGVSAPAVYRHFRSKSELLAGAIETGLDEIDEALRGATADGGELRHVVSRLATAALHRPDFWTLSQREIRHLAAPEQQHLRYRFRRVASHLGDAVDRARPHTPAGARDLLVAASMAALATPATQTSSLPTDRRHRLLSTAATALCLADLPTGVGQRARSRAAPPPPDRSSQVFATAVTLFHQRGYSAVSLDDIGDAVGMAGPSIYHHFASKADLLAGAAERFLSAVPTVTADSDVDTVAREYARAAIRERECVGVFVTEAIELPAGAAQRIGTRAAEDLAGWSAMVARRRPDLEPAEVGLLVETARSSVHDIARLGTHHRRPGIVEELTALTTAVLDVRY